MPVPNPADPSVLNTLQIFGRKKSVPKGTADAVMERLFPKQRSSVPVDSERRAAVFAILVDTGALEVYERGPVEFTSEVT